MYVYLEGGQFLCLHTSPTAGEGWPPPQCYSDYWVKIIWYVVSIPNFLGLRLANHVDGYCAFLISCISFLFMNKRETIWELQRKYYLPATSVKKRSARLSNQKHCQRSQQTELLNFRGSLRIMWTMLASPKRCNLIWYFCKYVWLTLPINQKYPDSYAPTTYSIRIWKFQQQKR